MKYIILKPFKDKITGKRYKVDKIEKFTKKRANEILKVDKLIEEFKEDSADCRESAEE